MGIILLMVTVCSMFAVVGHLMFSNIIYATFGFTMTFLSWFFLLFFSMVYQILKGKNNDE